VAISLKNEIPQLDIYATDISEDALKVAKQNSKALLCKEKVTFYQGDLFDALPCPSSFNLIVSNPPYIPTDEIQTLSAEVRNEPRLALDGGRSGLEIIERIIEKAPDYLKNSGVLLLEADPRQMEKIKKLLLDRGFKEINFYKDLAGHYRVIKGKYEK